MNEWMIVPDYDISLDCNLETILIIDQASRIGPTGSIIGVYGLGRCHYAGVWLGPFRIYVSQLKMSTVKNFTGLSPAILYVSYYKLTRGKLQAHLVE